MQELANKIWQNQNFHNAAQKIRAAWLARELKLEYETPDLATILKSIQASAILASSQNQDHRSSAFILATCAYDLTHSHSTPLDHALRVILTRLDNLPSLKTKDDINNSKPKLPPSLIIEEMHAFEAREISINEEKLTLTRFQKKLWKSLTSNHKTAISAPTSAGKSFVLQKYISHYLPIKKTALYIVPTRALITQVANDLYKAFSLLDHDFPSEILTISVEPNEPIPETVIFVMTQERAQLLLANHPSFKPQVLIVDEAHSISDGARGVLLQNVIDEAFRRSPNSQVLFASPMIENLDIFSKLFGADDIISITSTEPAVSQNFIKIKIDDYRSGKFSISEAEPTDRTQFPLGSVHLSQKLTTRAKILSRIPVHLSDGSVNIIYANGADEAERIAINIATLLRSRPNTKERDALAEISIESVHESYAMAACLRKGVAFHYGEVPALLRRSIEQAMTDGHLDYLVCTSTLLQGVNLPAKNIFLLNPEKGSNKSIKPTDFWNLAGRAGRLLREFQGNIFLIEYDKWKLKPLDKPKKEPVVSALEKTVKEDNLELLRTIRNRTLSVQSNNPDVESAFVRLFTDSRTGKIDTTLQRLGLPTSTGRGAYIKKALIDIHDTISLPDEILRQSPNI